MGYATSFRRQIKSAMKTYDVKPADLAKRMGVSKGAVYRMLSDHHASSAEKFDRAANALSIRLNCSPTQAMASEFPQPDQQQEQEQ